MHTKSEAALIFRKSGRYLYTERKYSCPYKENMLQDLRKILQNVLANQMTNKELWHDCCCSRNFQTCLGEICWN